MSLATTNYILEYVYLTCDFCRLLKIRKCFNSPVSQMDFSYDILFILLIKELKLCFLEYQVNCFEILNVGMEWVGF